MYSELAQPILATGDDESDHLQAALVEASNKNLLVVDKLMTIVLGNPITGKTHFSRILATSLADF